MLIFLGPGCLQAKHLRLVPLLSSLGYLSFRRNPSALKGAPHSEGTGRAVRFLRKDKRDGEKMVQPTPCAKATQDLYLAHSF